MDEDSWRDQGRACSLDIAWGFPLRLICAHCFAKKSYKTLYAESLEDAAKLLDVPAGFQVILGVDAQDALRPYGNRMLMKPEDLVASLSRFYWTTPIVCHQYVHDGRS